MRVLDLIELLFDLFLHLFHNLMHLEMLDVFNLVGFRLVLGRILHIF